MFPERNHKEDNTEGKWLYRKEDKKWCHVAGKGKNHVDDADDDILYHAENALCRKANYREE